MGKSNVFEIIERGSIAELVALFIGDAEQVNQRNEPQEG